MEIRLTLKAELSRSAKSRSIREKRLLQLFWQ
jgi:hypothetical protein